MPSARSVEADPAGPGSPDQGNLVQEGSILTPCVIEDDDLLAEAVDAAILHLDGTNAGLLDLRVEIKVAEEALRAVEPAIWPAYLRVDELRTARTADLAVMLVRWAFTCGYAAQHPGAR